MKLSPFEIKRGRRELQRQLAEIRASGQIVVVLEDCGVLATIRCHNGEGDAHEMLVDPLRLVARLRAEAQQ